MILCVDHYVFVKYYLIQKSFSYKVISYGKHNQLTRMLFVLTGVVSSLVSNQLYGIDRLVDLDQSTMTDIVDGRA